MAYDDSAKQVVMVGGQTYKEDEADDVWAWRGESWTQLPSGPPGRIAPAMAYDLVHDELVVYGGYSLERGSVLGETWVSRDDGWTRRSPQLSPPPVWAASMAFDPKLQQVILFGGYTDDGSELSDETWTWNGTSWSQLQPEDVPPARARMGLAYDPTRDALVLFGGWRKTLPEKAHHDTWTWDGANWTLQSLRRSPSARAEFVMSTFRHHVMMFGGRTDNDGRAGSATWLLTGKRWKRIHPTTSPETRFWSMSGWDAATRDVVMFSGIEHGTDNDTWLLSRAPRSQRDGR